MRSTENLVSKSTIFVVAAVLFGWFFGSPLPARAQQGQDAVYNSSNGVVGSSAFIDASMFPATGRDFCGVLNWVLNPAHGILPAAGGVIDARGLPNSNSAY
jgi:hypothetical protein